MYEITPPQAILAPDCKVAAIWKGGDVNRCRRCGAQWRSRSWNLDRSPMPAASIWKRRAMISPAYLERGLNRSPRLCARNRRLRAFYSWRNGAGFARILAGRIACARILTRHCSRLERAGPMLRLCRA